MTGNKLKTLLLARTATPNLSLFFAVGKKVKKSTEGKVYSSYTLTTFYVSIVDPTPTYSLTTYLLTYLVPYLLVYTVVRPPIIIHISYLSTYY